MHPYVLRAERRGVSTNRGARPAALLLCGENREAWRAPFARHLMFGWFLVPMSSARALSVFLSTPFSHSHTHVHTRTHIHCPSHCGRDRMARGPSFRKERRGSRTSRGLPRALARQPPLWVWGEGAGRGVDPAWPVGGGSGLGLPRTPPHRPIGAREPRFPWPPKGCGRSTSRAVGGQERKKQAWELLAVTA